MIGQLHGIILEKQPPEILLDVNGVGYEVSMPMTCFYDLPENGAAVRIFTHFVVREDAQLLYGFNSKQERTLFRELIKVNGVGPKLALAILSGMSASQFVNTVEQGEIKQLVKLPGVGTKTAERLIIEMKDRLKRLTANNSIPSLSSHSDEPSLITVEENAESEAISALVALGYKPQEASKIISRIYQSGMDSEALIRAALKAAL